MQIFVKVFLNLRMQEFGDFTEIKNENNKQFIKKKPCANKFGNPKFN